jgi:hypothetical protein
MNHLYHDGVATILPDHELGMLPGERSALGYFPPQCCHYVTALGMHPLLTVGNI